MRFYGVIRFTTLLIAYASRSSGEKCLQCNGVPSIQDCNRVVECAADEKCYVKAMRQDTGITLYELGCLKSQTCSILDGLVNVGRKRSSTECYECCGGTGSSQGPCNRHLCGSQVSSSSGYTRCYRCSSVVDPSDCNQIETCDRDSSCSLRSSGGMLPGGYGVRYDLGCISKRVCTVFNALSSQQGSGTTIHYCNQCCDEDLCNINLCGFGQLVKPVFTWKPNNFSVVPGVENEVTLICKTDVRSNATIHWSFVSESGSTRAHIPNNVLVSSAPNSSNVTLPITTENYGVWTCTAKNAAGTASTTATVSNGMFLPTYIEP